MRTHTWTDRTGWSTRYPRQTFSGMALPLQQYMYVSVATVVGSRVYAQLPRLPKQQPGLLSMWIEHACRHNTDISRLGCEQDDLGKEKMKREDPALETSCMEIAS
jgi:hypothetical protein